MGNRSCPRSRQRASSTELSTPLSINPIATPAPVARGSRSRRSGVSSANRSSNTVLDSFMGGQHLFSAHPNGRPELNTLQVVEQAAQVFHHGEAMLHGGRAMSQRQDANAF